MKRGQIIYKIIEEDKGEYLSFVLVPRMIRAWKRDLRHLEIYLNAVHHSTEAFLNRFEFDRLIKHEAGFWSVNRDFWRSADEEGETLAETFMRFFREIDQYTDDQEEQVAIRRWFLRRQLGDIVATALGASDNPYSAN